MEQIKQSIINNAEALFKQKELSIYKMEKVKEYGVKIIRFIVQSTNEVELNIDFLGEVNKELLDLVNDDLEDDEYLALETVGLEQPILDNYEDYIGKYIYVSLYERIPEIKEKEFNGDLLEVTDEDITINAEIKNIVKKVKINKKNIAVKRTAVRF